MPSYFFCKTSRKSEGKFLTKRRSGCNNFFVILLSKGRKVLMQKGINNTSLGELIAEINEMLKGNPRAVQLVYYFLIGLKHGQK